MKYTRRCQSYDVKSFLNRAAKEDKRGSFKGGAISGTGVLAVLVLAAIALAFAVIAKGCTGADGTMGSRLMVYSASPFFMADSITTESGLVELILQGGSAFLESKPHSAHPTKPKAPPLTENYLSKGSEVEIKNETDYTVDIPSVLSEDVRFPPDARVLIVHTHGSESYTPGEGYSFEHTGNYRTCDKRYNMIAVGEELARALESKGVEVIHDKSINDYPSYNQSYNKTETIIQGYLSRYDDIVFVFDIHRDAVGTPEEPVKFTAELGGRSVARVMTVCGTDTNLHNPNWRQNLALGLHIQQHFSELYPGFMRPLNLRKERFNMHLTTGSLLFEVGTNGNSLAEALEAARILGEGIGSFIQENT